MFVFSMTLLLPLTWRPGAQFLPESESETSDDVDSKAWQKIKKTKSRNLFSKQV